MQAGQHTTGQRARAFLDLTLKDTEPDAQQQKKPRRGCLAAARQQCSVRAEGAKSGWNSGKSSVLFHHQVHWSLVRDRPALLLWPAALLCVLLVLGVWAVVCVAQGQASYKRSQACSLVTNTANALENLFNQIAAPAQALAAALQSQRVWGAIEPIYADVAKPLFDRVGAWSNASWLVKRMAAQAQPAPSTEWVAEHGPCACVLLN